MTLAPRTHSAHAQLLTIGEAADYLGTGQRFVRRLIAERRIAYVKLGKLVRLERSILDAFIEAGRMPSVHSLGPSDQRRPQPTLPGRP